jgi:hypothetical protein
MDLVPGWSRGAATVVSHRRHLCGCDIGRRTGCGVCRITQVGFQVDGGSIDMRLTKRTSVFLVAVAAFVLLALGLLTPPPLEPRTIPQPI